MATRTRPDLRRCSFEELGAVPSLFADYCARFDAVGDHYARDWRSETDRRAAAADAADRPADRDALADVLAEQNAEWGGGDAAQANVEALRDPASVAVVTGQQVGLFTGPLYTIYKTLTALRLTERLADETDRPVVPVFWVEGEDHDLEEIASTCVLHRNDRVALDYDGHATGGPGDNLGAVGRLALTDQIDAVVDRLDEALPPSDFKPEVMEHVWATYRPGTPLEDAFARLTRRLFRGKGLVFVNPDDRRLKRQAAPLFRRDLEDPEGAPRRVNAAGEALEDAGYHAQVTARPTNLFWLEDDGRYAIDWEGGDRFTLRHDGRSFSRAELLDRLDAEPERFSANVVLRPLMQDALLPTAAYVAGPGEVSYFAQYRGVYDWAGLDMPVIHPRASVSLVEGKVQKVLDKYDLSLGDVAGRDGGLETLFQSVVVDAMEDGLDDRFDDTLRRMHQAINDLKPEVEDVDSTLAKSVEAARAGVMEAMNDLKHKVVRAEKRQHDEVRQQLEKAHANLWPGGGLQERKINVLYFLNKYSPGLLDDLRETISLDTSAHQVVPV